MPSLHIFQKSNISPMYTTINYFFLGSLSYNLLKVGGVTPHQ